MRDPIIFLICIAIAGVFCGAAIMDRHIDEKNADPMTVVNTGDNTVDETPPVYRIVITGIRGQVKFDVVSYTFYPEKRSLVMVMPNGDTVSASTKGAYWTHRMLKPNEVGEYSVLEVPGE